MYKTGGILLCAGFGSRLAPLTEAVPKPAIPFCGVPMAHYARRALEQAGVEAMGMNVHHLPEQMIAAMDHGTWKNGPIHISREGNDILGTGGGAARVADLMPDMERFIIYHGDVLCGVSLTDALKSHIQSGARVTLVVLPRPHEIHENVRQSLGMIGVKNNEIVLIRDWKKYNTDISNYIPRCFSGIHIVERSVLDEIQKDKNTCLVTQIYKNMLERGETIHAWEPSTSVFFADVGTPATYLFAQANALKKYIQNAPDALPFFDQPHILSCLDATQTPSVSFGADQSPNHINIAENVCLCQGAQYQTGESLKNEMRFAHGGIRLTGTWISA